MEPTGIDPRNTSTAADLMRLAKLVMADPVIPGMVAMPYLDVPGMDPTPNTNDLLGSNGITGLKTGTLEGSGSNLLFSVQMPVAGISEPLTVIGVVLGGYSRQSVDADVIDLLTSIAAGFHPVPVVQAGDEVGTYTTAWGDSARMVAGDSASLLTWSDTPITAEMQTTTLTTGADTEQVGSITWTAGPQTVTVPVLLKGSITSPTAWWRLTHPFELAEQG